MTRGILLVLSLALLSNCGNDDGEGTPEKYQESPADHSVGSEVLYGEDNRLDLYQVTNPETLALADSTVALMAPSNLRSTIRGSVEIFSGTFGVSYNLCSAERFREQQNPAFCSGSLIGPDIVLTAGHCVTSAKDCSGTKLVFGFAVKAMGIQPTEVAASEVYSCARVIHSEQTSKGADFALIQLDRPVQGHTPLPIRTSGKIQSGEPLLVIGHPSGLPTKVAAGAKVRDNSPSSYFVGNLDTYGGNSGSAVFNANTGLIEGVLVRGENDFVSQGSCTVSNKCRDDSCRGEDVTRISEVLPYLVSSGGAGGGGLAEEVYSINPQMQIPDNNSQGIQSKLNIPSTPQGRSILVTLDLTHTWIGDLIITLESPEGVVIVLQKQSGGSADNIRGTYGKNLTALGNLKSLSQVSVTGNWILRVSDVASRDIGTLVSWSVTFAK